MAEALRLTRCMPEAGLRPIAARRRYRGRKEIIAHFLRRWVAERSGAGRRSNGLTSLREK